MATSIVTPLQLTAVASLLQNQGLKTLPSALTTAITNYNATVVIADFLAAVAFYQAASFKTQSTLEQLLQIGATVCPALGDSIPASPVGSYPYLTQEYITDVSLTGSNVDQNGFANLIEQTGSLYIGDSFYQGFQAIQGYIQTTNQYINTSVNANTYLGPTFTNMNALITSDISTVNTNITNFGIDLARQGNLWNLANIELYGTPAGLLQQISKQAKIQGDTLPALRTRLINAGLTSQNISNLINNNRFGLFNQNGLSDNDFNRLQQIAYQTIATVDGTELADILAILDITTPNITTLGDLLNPVKTFPTSYDTMQTISDNGPVLIYGPSASVNSNIGPIVDATLPTASGCDELGKIIPRANAVANKAIQLALQQIPNVINTTLPLLAEAVNGFTPTQWNVDNEYLANSVVSDGLLVPTIYQAIDDVLPGTNLTDTNYWTPTTLGALNTISDLPLIADQTTPVDSSVTTYFATSIATGSGPNGEITTYDILGTAIDYNDLATQFNSATANINTLNGLGTLNTLKATFVSMLGSANDAAMIGYIATANANIVTIAAAQPALVASLNIAWNVIATSVNSEAGYQSKAGISYFTLTSGDQVTTYGFVQNLPTYAKLTANQQAAEFLEDIADTTTLGGQAIVGVMREARNATRLNQSRIQLTANQIPSNPPLDPIPVVVPVN